ncbi:MAG: hypothetical protein ACON4U_03060 [Myxococcota bacterium]
MFFLLFACQDESSKLNGNTPPQITITSHQDGDTVPSNELVQLLAQASDDEDDSEELVVWWTKDDSQICPPLQWSFGLSSCNVSFETGAHNITVYVTDSTGVETSANLTLNAEIQNNLILEILSPSAGSSWYADQVVPLQGRAIGENIQDVVFEWSSSRDGVIDGGEVLDTNNESSTEMQLTPGDHQIIWSALQNDSVIADTAVTISVNSPNTTPSCEILSPLPPQPETDYAIWPIDGEHLLLGQASDNEVLASELVYTWTSDIDGPISNGSVTTDGRIENVVNLSSGIHQISLQVVDEVGAVCEAQSAVYVNTAPTIQINSPAPGQLFQSGEIISLIVSGDDDEDGASGLSVTISSDISGFLGTANLDGAGNGYADLILDTGIHNLTVTATDSGGFSTAAGIEITVNTPPTVPILVLGPDPAYTSDDLVATASGAFDLEGEVLTYSYIWYRDGILQGTHTGATVSSADTLKGEEWLVEVFASDSFISGPSTSSSVIIQNTPPVVSSVTVLPTLQPTSQDSLSCSATVTDPDDSPSVVTSWLDDGVLLTTGSTVDLSQFTVLPNSVITCEVAATDIDGITTVESSTAVVQNTMPVIDNISVSPDPIYADSGLICSASVSDIDQNSIVINTEWFQNGASIGEGVAIGLDPSFVQVGDTISCQITAEDSYGGTVTDVEELTVQNSLPIISQVEISPPIAFANSIIGCQLTASDIDGSVISETYIWEVQSSGQVLGNQFELTLTPTLVAPGDVVVCRAVATDVDGGTDESTLSVTIQNTEPVFTDGPLITPSSDIQVGTPLFCSATVEDLDDGILSWSNAWFVDGVEVSTSSAFSPSESNSNVGSTISCLVNAVDNDGALVSASTSVTIGNSAPVMNAVVVSPNTAVTTDALLLCEGSGTDPDLDSLTYHYAWYNTTAGQQIGVSDVLQLDASLVSPEDQVTCTVTVEDENGSTDTLSESITVVNTAPVLNSVGIVPIQGAFSNALLSCEATAEDLDNDSLSFSYLWAKGNILLGASSTLQLAPTVVQPQETITCTVTVTDAFGGTDSAAANVVIENTPPVISSAVINPSTFFNDQSISCAVTATDTDNQALAESFEWRNATTGQILGTGSNLVLSSMTASVGDTIECLVTVTDPDNGSATEISSSAVLNRTPNLSSVTISPNLDVTASTTLNCTSASDDPDNEALTTAYQWLSGGSQLGTGASIALVPSMVQPGDTVQCRATVTDPSGAEDSNQASVDIVNIDPVATTLTISPSVIYNDSTVTCNVAGTDADNQTLTESYQWRIGGVLIGNTQSLTLSSLTASAGDELECTGTVTDVSGGNDTLVDSIVIDNRVPTVSGVTILPTSPTTNSTLNCTVSGQDADDEILTESYAWLNVSTGQLLGTGSSLSLDPSIVQPSEVIQCSAQLTDPNSASASDTQTVTAVNTSPAISGISITPSITYNDTVLTCSVSGSDADDQSLVASYQWSNGNVVLGTAQTLTLSSSLAQVGDSISCVATLTDTSGATVSTSTSTTVSNRGPVAGSASISPSTNVVTGTELTCTGNASDPDNDTLSISYTWVKGISVLSSANTLTLLSSQVQPGDTVSCIMTVSDPSGITDTVSDSIIVNNTPPVIDSLVIAPSAMFNDDTLTCDLSASDLDDQTLAVDIQWSNNGNTIGTNQELTLFPSVAMPGDLVRCTVVVTDTSGASVSSFTEGTVLNRSPSLTTPILSSNSPTLGSTLTCSSTGSDVDNDAVTVSYQWYLNSLSNSVVHTGASLELLANGTPTSGQVLASVEDDVYCVATATDANGSTESKHSMVSIINTDPTITSMSISPNTAYNDSTLVCTAVSIDSDAQSTTTAYAWTNGSSVIGSNSILTLSAATAVPGDNIRCTAEVTDSSGGSTTSFAERVVSNRDPVINTPTLNASNPTLGSTLTCSANGFDADNDTVTVSYAWYINSISSSEVHNGESLEILASGTPSSGQVVGNINDDVFCLATATDVNGASDTKQVSATIVNTNPVINSVSISPSPAYNDSVLACTVVASDTDAQSLNITYSWTNGINTLGTNQPLALSAQTAVPGDTLRCTATVTDSSGGSDTRYGELILTNRNPVVTTPTLTYSSPHLGSTLTCNATGSDVDNDSVTVSYAWYINSVSGAAVHTGTALELLASGTPSSGQVVAEVGDDIVCVATATDAYGATDTKESEVAILNVNPSISSVSMTPTTAYNTSTMICTVVASDPDAQSLATSYIWTNGTSILGSNQTLILSSALAAPGDVIRCTAVVTDTSGGTDSSFAEQTLSNRAPVLATTSISPSSPTLGSTLTCSANAFDNDNDSLSINYAWYLHTVNSGVVHTGPSLEILSSGTPGSGQVLASLGDSVICVATVTDPNGLMDTAQVNSTVVNSPPVINSITLTPNSGVFNDSVLTCSVNASDSDGHSLTTSYAWTNLTQGTNLGTNPSLPLSSTMANSNEVIRCTASVNDGFGGSTSLFTSVTTGNRPPVITSVDIDNTTPSFGDTVNCNTMLSDADNDTVSITHTWVSGGNTVGSGPSYTVAYSDLGKIVFCRITANDGLLSVTRDSTSDNSSILLADLIVSATSVSLPEGAYTLNALNILNGGTLNVSGSTSLTVQDIMIESGSVIDGDGAAGNAGSIASDANGNGASLHSTNTASGGGGYGGRGGSGGGLSSPSIGGIPFGTVAGTDISVGGASAGVSCTGGASGGAALSIFISGSGTIAGDITVNGNDGLNCSDPQTTGGGSGGGILISPTGAATLDFTGYLSAYGGNGGLCLTNTCNGGGGGGGGRIKILGFTSFINMTGTFNVDGGLGDLAGNNPGHDGEVGTVYIENFHNGAVRQVNGTWQDVSFELCGLGCDATSAQAVCSAVGKKLVSHASDGSTQIFTLGAADSCQHSTSYFTVDTNMPSSACLVGISSLEWSSPNSCCNVNEWHGYSIPFGSPTDIFGRVVNGDSGFVSAHPNLANGIAWGCYNNGISASVSPSCSEVYVACAN